MIAALRFSEQVDLIEQTPSLCQQGTATRGIWKIFPVSGSLTWENALCGWSSVSESSTGTNTRNIDFPDRDSAVSYCRRHGLEIRSIDNHAKKLLRTGSTIMSGSLRRESKPKSYGDNFSVMRKGTPEWGENRTVN